MARFINLLGAGGLAFSLATLTCSANESLDFQCGNIATCGRNEAENDDGVKAFDCVFERQVFGGAGPAAIAAAQARLAFILRQRIAALDCVCQLTAGQKGMLEIAGRGDIHRVMHRIENLRQEFREISRDDEGLANFYLRDFLTEQERDAIFEEPFREGSLVMKTVRKIADAEQTSKLSSFLRDRPGPPVASRAPVGDPRTIQYSAWVIIVEHKKALQNQARTDEFLGRRQTLGGTSATTHDVSKSSDWAALLDEGVVETIDVLTRPTVTCSNGSACSIEVASNPEKSQSRLRLQITPTIEAGGQVHLGIVLGVISAPTTAGPLAQRAASLAVGSTRGATRRKPGEQIIISGLSLPKLDGADNRAEVDQKKPESDSENATGIADEREVIVILSGFVIK